MKTRPCRKRLLAASADIRKPVERQKRLHNDAPCWKKNWRRFAHASRSLRTLLPREMKLRLEFLMETRSLKRAALKIVKNLQAMCRVLVVIVPRTGTKFWSGGRRATTIT